MFSKSFWSKVNKTKTCWLWTGGQEHGYGRVLYTTSYSRWRTRAHRVAWELAYGLIPQGKFVCHACDVKLCVRPSHLFIGTQFDNMRDAARKGRLIVPNVTGLKRSTETLHKMRIAQQKRRARERVAL